MKKIENVPTTLITGFLGAGKTTAIRQWLAQKPSHERWAVLVNEFGELGIDGAAITRDEDGIAVAEVSGGCICCSAAVSLRTAVTKLLRDARADRLLIEPTGLGHAAYIIDLLKEPGLRDAIQLNATICIVDPRAFNNPEIMHSQLFQDQIAIADILVANKADVAKPQDMEAFRIAAENAFPRKLRVLSTVRSELDVSLLDLCPEAVKGVRTYVPNAQRQKSIWPEEPAVQSYESRGWQFGASQVFVAAKLDTLFAQINKPGGIQIPGLARAKGVLRTGRNWRLVNWIGGETSWDDIAHRRDSRVEVIVTAQAEMEKGLEAFQLALDEAMQKQPAL